VQRQQIALAILFYLYPYTYASHPDVTSKINSKFARVIDGLEEALVKRD